MWRILQPLLLLTGAFFSVLEVGAAGPCSFPGAQPRHPDSLFDGSCQNLRGFHDSPSRAHSFSIADFGAVGDGKTLNTRAFKRAIAHLQSFAAEGGAKLYVPPGKWLTGSFNLTSHLTFFLDRDAVILGSEVSGQDKFTSEAVL